MCRMIAIISKSNNISADVLNYYLISANKSLIKQSNFDKERLQKDGWGIGYYENKKAVVFKSPNPVYEEKDILENEIKKINSKIFLAHIRYASNPRNLDKKKLISYYNSQPFIYQNFIFTHNGTLSIVDEVSLNLGKYLKYIKGLNDSEVLFWHFVKHLDAYGDIKTALLMMRDEINTVWISVKKYYPKLKKPYNGLNIFLTDGKDIYGICDFKMEKEKYAIMTDGWEYGRFAYREEKDYLVFSSEPIDDGNWLKVNDFVFFKIFFNGKLEIEKIN